MYEVLMDIGTAGIKRDFEFETVTADFGGGWYAAAVLDSTPIRTWTLSWSGTYHDPYERPALVQPRYQDGSTLEDVQSRLKYLQRFFARRMTNGNEAFYMIDPAELGNPLTPTYWLVRMDVNTITFSQSGSEKQRWDFSVKCRLSRVPGVPQTITPTIPFP
jgi:hypothetical protein